jgi:hypothetical protein
MVFSVRVSDWCQLLKSALPPFTKEGVEHFPPHPDPLLSGEREVGKNPSRPPFSKGGETAI